MVSNGATTAASIPSPARIRSRASRSRDTVSSPSVGVRRSCRHPRHARAQAGPRRHPDRPRASIDYDVRHREDRLRDRCPVAMEGLVVGRRFRRRGRCGRSCRWSPSSLACRLVATAWVAFLIALALGAVLFTVEHPDPARVESHYFPWLVSLGLKNRTEGAASGSAPHAFPGWKRLALQDDTRRRCWILARFSSLRTRPRRSARSVPNSAQLVRPWRTILEGRAAHRQRKRLACKQRTRTLAVPPHRQVVAPVFQLPGGAAPTGRRGLTTKTRSFPYSPTCRPALTPLYRRPRRTGRPVSCALVEDIEPGPYRTAAHVLLLPPHPLVSAEFSPVMTRPNRVSNLRQLQRNAEAMARLSPFTADRVRFSRMAERYREEADRLEPGMESPLKEA